ncbi:hypothetical protein RFI_10576, partial [Reticulomyxa filosa]
MRNDKKTDKDRMQVKTQHNHQKSRSDMGGKEVERVAKKIMQGMQRQSLAYGALAKNQTSQPLVAATSFTLFFIVSYAARKKKKKKKKGRKSENGHHLACVYDVKKDSNNNNNNSNSNNEGEEESPLLSKMISVPEKKYNGELVSLRGPTLLLKQQSNEPLKENDMYNVLFWTQSTGKHKAGNSAAASPNGGDTISTNRSAKDVHEDAHFPSSSPTAECEEEPNEKPLVNGLPSLALSQIGTDDNEDDIEVGAEFPSSTTKPPKAEDMSKNAPSNATMHKEADSDIRAGVGNAIEGLWAPNYKRISKSQKRQGNTNNE